MKSYGTTFVLLLSPLSIEQSGAFFSHENRFLSLSYQYEYSSWSSELPLARVTHWGGMISTPDVVLQESIKCALIENGCPRNIIDSLMENAHERNWPEGISTLGRTNTSSFESLFSFC